MQILLVYEKTVFDHMLSFNLESQLSAVCHWTGSYAEALNYLLEDQSIDVVILQDNQESVRICKYLLLTHSRVACILVGPEANNAFDVFPDIVKLGTLPSLESGNQKIVDLIKIGMKTGVIKNHVLEGGEYSKIRTDLLLEMLPLQTDVYLQLSSAKFVKMFAKGGVFTKEDSDKYLGRKNVQYFYVKKEDVQVLVSHFQQKITEMTERNEQATSEGLTPQEKKAHFAGTLNEAVSNFHQLLGFTPEVKQMALHGVKQTIESIQVNPAFEDVMALIKKHQGSYFSFHSIATAHMACVLAKRLGWETDKIVDKLCMASFFHDFMLKNHRLSEICTLNDFNRQSIYLSPEELVNFQSHPLETATLLRLLEETPRDVDLIITQHHERPDGSGFPRNLKNEQIFPLSALFIVAHDVVRFLYLGKANEGFRSFVRYFRYDLESSAKGNFKKILSVVQFPGDEPDVNEKLGFD